MTNKHQLEPIWSFYSLDNENHNTISVVIRIYIYTHTKNLLAELDERKDKKKGIKLPCLSGFYICIKLSQLNSCNDKTLESTWTPYQNLDQKEWVVAHPM